MTLLAADAPFRLDMTRIVARIHIRIRGPNGSRAAGGLAKLGETEGIPLMRFPRGRSLRLLTLVSALAVSLVLAGCSSAPRAKPLPTLDTFAIVTSNTAAKDLEANSTAGKAARGIGTGAAGGMATGATAGLACGPFLWFCVPFGALVGSVAGGVVGGVSEGAKGLPNDAAKAVSAALQQLDEERDFDRELESELTTALGERVVAMEDAVATITLQITRIDLLQHSRKNLSLRMRADMTVTWERGAKRPRQQVNQYEFETARESVDAWLADDGARFGSGLSECVDRINRAMTRDLGI